MKVKRKSKKKLYKKRKTRRILKGGDSYKIRILGIRDLYNFFEDYVNSLEYSLKQLNVPCETIIENEFNSDYFNKEENKASNIIYIVLQKLDKFHLQNIIDPKNVFIFNTESLFKEDYLAMLSLYLQKGYRIIDYSLSNINILISKNVDKTKLFYIPYQVNMNEIKNYQKINELSYISASQSDNRTKYTEFVKKSNIIPFNIVSGFKNERNSKLLPSKFMLNIHYKVEWNQYESIRCDRLIFNKMIVISENCLEDSIPDEIKKYIVQYANEDELGNILKSISINPDDYYNNFWKDFNLEDIKNIRLNYLKNFINILKQ